ncbi:hypothetical protein HB762_28120 (plasmid) [Vibrio campbellii]|uniref:Uncharacterized protein n=1 Tax=Vibrio campbellii TaxID=680 RepID=A0ABY5IQJ6_9VIBR|nr:hypothetical protein [Vibrio campbellii]UTZ35040.1 hypothetical protein HB762_27640 [Vibrio campbellii]UTZ35131.1 hypothetical protein HB762_28120 [Vibrio campbellii]
MGDFDWFELLCGLGFHEISPNLFNCDEYDFYIKTKDVEGKTQLEVVRLLLDKQKEALLEEAYFEARNADAISESD